MRDDLQLLLGTHFADPSLGKDFQQSDLGGLATGSGGSGEEPGDEDLVVDGIAVEPMAAPVWDLHGRLAEKQAVAGRHQADSPLVSLSNDRRSVATRVEAKHRELETALSVLGSVARATVAAVFAENRPHLFAETDGWIVHQAADGHLDQLHLATITCSPDLDTGCSIVASLQFAGGGDTDHPGIQRRVADSPGQVVGAVCWAVALGQFADDQLQPREIANQ